MVTEWFGLSFLRFQWPTEIRPGIESTDKVELSPERVWRGQPAVKCLSLEESLGSLSVADQGFFRGIPPLLQS